MNIEDFWFKNVCLGFVVLIYMKDVNIIEDFVKVVFDVDNKVIGIDLGFSINGLVE